MRKLCLLLAVSVLAAGLLASYARAEGVPTKVLVRAVSRDAKIIGDGVGGARITIRDPASGQVLAQGIQRGGSGDTKSIMREPHERHAPVYDTEGAAHFLATLSLERPMVVEITAEGPLEPAHATQRASKRVLLIPGMDVLGEGVLLEIHGFIAELLTPQEGAGLPAGQPLEVRAKVRMA
jgi:hypothetical protein